MTSQADGGGNAASTNLLLVHGACHGAWCWEIVAPLLESEGFRVRAVDLPGRGGNRKPGWGPSLRDYAVAVVEAAAAMGGPVVMLGHSMGGQIISAASELAPERFTRLVYLSAFLPADGDSIVSMSRHNAGSELSRATHVSLIRGRLSILGTAAGPVFYGDCAPEMIAQATGRLAPESLRPSFQRISLSRERFGRVPRSYIRLTEDRAITPAFQDWMLSRQPCERVQSLESSHSPFLSMPAALASAIRSVVDGSPT